ncbi:hypothetical protein N0V83_009672 [Neocucurbitaria cava]|uniref:Nuclear speckle splicing regulatory protein 1 N-terminal domain-containing protein n=1 Tax=Neocucurbitaria cava TaxID=798079 RepID=A0A9W8Y0L5_9PLEO|nr:hypothetical protein N0V83_009672 [Neocucurbitaria cava]
MSFKFGLKVKNKAANPLANPAAKKGLGKKKPLFDDDDEDVKGKGKAADGAQEIGELNFEDILPLAIRIPKKGQPPAPPNRKPKALEDDPTIGYSASTQESERWVKEAMEADASIYDYDAAYDAIHAASAAKKAAAQEESAERKPKYMAQLLASAELRKKDELRARDKLLQREREAEGDEFADKEKFVTGAYKAQQEEARKAEEEEKLRQEAEEAKKKKLGMLGFHKQMLMEQEQRHQEAVEAAAKALKEGIKPPLVEEGPEKTNAELIEEARKQGRKVILTEDGQVADNFSLLSAGLNIISKPKPAPKPADPSSSISKPQLHQQAGGTKSERNAQRERQTQMIAEQIELANKRKADQEAEEQARLLHASKSQKTATDISSAKERYLQRKREAAAAKATAGK